jgi:hypothetical protein
MIKDATGKVLPVESFVLGHFIGSVVSSKSRSCSTKIEFISWVKPLILYKSDRLTVKLTSKIKFSFSNILFLSIFSSSNLASINFLHRKANDIG